MQLGEMIATYDVAVALRGETGKFEITSPTGDIFRVTCKPSHSISNLEWSGSADSQPFIIRKVAETVSLRQTPSGMSEENPPAQPTSAPFLIGNREPEMESSLTPDTVTSATKEEVDDGSGADLDLVYMEREPETNQPLWRVCMKSEDGITKAVTVSCSTFNELDAEIRRLQAQLDEIRSRARKSIYKLQAVAASA